MRFIVAGYGPAVVALREISVTAVEVGAHEFWNQPDRFVIVGDGAVIIALCVEDQTTVT